MKCAYHPDRESSAACSECGKPLCGECALPRKDGTFICSRCAALTAARESAQGIAQRSEEKDGRERKKAALKKRKGRLWTGLLLAVGIISIGVICIQAPGLMSLFKEDRPIRQGTYQTDEKTDQCIRNLWKIARLLQEGKPPGDLIRCPLSHKAYVIIRTKDDVVARCPTPGLHGFREIRVSRKHPVPELIK